jgi:hypothetical protein
MRAKTILAMTAIATMPLMTCSLFKVGLGAKVDITPPALLIASPATSSYVRGDFVISGEASDDTGIRELTLRVWTSTIQPVVTALTTGPDATWSATIDSSTFAPSSTIGDQAEVLVTCTDIAGKSTTASIKLYLDNSPPEFWVDDPSMESLDQASKALTHRSLDNTVRFSGRARDFGGSELELWLTATYNSVSVRREIEGTTNWSLDLDTRSLLTDFGIDESQWNVPYNVDLVFSVLDPAGNQTDISGVARIDQNSDAPIIVISKLGIDLRNGPPIPSAEPVLFAPGDTLTITVEDDDAVDLDGVAVRLLPVAGGSAWTPAGALALSRVNSNGYAGLPVSVDFVYTIPTDSATLPQGKYAFEVSSSDDVDGKPSSTELVATRTISGSGASTIIVDSGLPSLSIGSPANGSYVTTLAISGTASDGYDIDDIFIKLADSDLVQGGDQSVTVTASKAPVSGKVYSWSYTFSSIVADGDYELEVWAVDKAGQQSASKNLAASIDRTPPEVTLNSPVLLDTDVTPVASVPQNGIVALGARITDGAKTADAYFKISASNAPALPNLGASIPEWAGWTPTLQTTIAKDTWYRIANATRSQTFSFSDKLFDSSDITPDGQYYLHFVAADVLGNLTESDPQSFVIEQGSDTPVITVNNLTAKMTGGTEIQVVVVDDDGYVPDDDVVLTLDTVQQSLTKDNTKTFSKGLASVGNGYYSSTYIFKIPDDIEQRDGHVIQVTASDVAASKREAPSATGLLSESGFTFAVDSTPPQFSGLRIVDAETPDVITYVTTDSLWTNGGFTFRGTARDSLNKVETITVTFGGVPSVGPEIPATTTILSPASPSQEAEFAFPMPYIDTGVYTMVVFAKDDFGNSNRANYTFQVDSTKPEAAISTPNANGTRLSGNAVIEGQASDSGGSLLSKVQYALRAGTDAPTDEAEWKDASGTTSWNALILTTDYAEGTYTLWVRSWDNAGNMDATLKSRQLWIDQSNPSLTVDALASGYAKASFAVKASASDAPGTGIASVTVAVDGAEYAAAFVSGSGKYELDLGAVGSPAVDRFALLAEGQHSLTVRAQDNSGRIAESSLVFFKDTILPTVTPDGSNPVMPLVRIAEVDYVNGSVTLRGVAADTNIDTLVYSYTDSTSTVITGTALNPLTWAITINTKNISGPNASDDELVVTRDVTVIARDKAGNQSVPSVITLKVWQTTDKPRITLNAEDTRLALGEPSLVDGQEVLDDDTPSDYIKYNVFDSSGKLSIKVEDDDLAVGSTVAVAANVGLVEAQNPVSAAWKSAGTKADSTEFTLEYALLPTAGNGLREGINWIWVRAYDVNGKETVKGPVYFAIDSAAPVFSAAPLLTARNGSPFGGTDWYINGSFTVGGTVTDANGIRKVNVKLGSQDAVDVYPDSAGVFSWSGDADLAGHVLPEGPSTLVVTAYDLYEKSVTTTIGVQVKRTGPTIGSLSSPALLNASTIVDQNGVLVLATSATDAYQTGDFFFKIALTLGTEPYTPPSASETLWVNGTSTLADGAWFRIANASNGKTFSFSDVLLDTTDLANASYKLLLCALDALGNATYAGPYDFVIDQTKDNPTYLFSNLSDKMKPNSAFTLTLTDDDAWIQEISLKLDDSALGVPTAMNSVSNGRYQSVYIVTLPADLSETEGTATHKIDLVVKDLPSEEKNGAAQATVTAPASYFKTDVTAPVFSLLKLNGLDISGDTVWANGVVALGVSGTSSDGHKIQKVTISYDSVNYAAGTASPASPADSPYAWTWSLGSVPASGTHSLSITAEDDFGNSQRVSYSLIVDSNLPSAPVVDMPSLDLDLVSGSLSTLSGTSADIGPSGIDYVQVSLALRGSAADVTASPAWTLATGAARWTYSFDSTKLPTEADPKEGTYRARVRSVDKAGNVGPESVRLVVIDQGAPTLGVTSAANQIRKLAFAISGTASDPVDAYDLSYGVKTIPISREARPGRRVRTALRPGITPCPSTRWRKASTRCTCAPTTRPDATRTRTYRSRRTLSSRP